MSLYKKTLASRYFVNVTEYQGSYYIHLRDLKLSKLGLKRYVTLHPEAISQLSRTCQEISTLLKERNEEAINNQEEIENLLEDHVLTETSQKANLLGERHQHSRENSPSSPPPQKKFKRTAISKR